MYFATLLKTTAPVKLTISQLSLLKKLGKYKPNHVYKVSNLKNILSIILFTIKLDCSRFI